MVRQYDVFRANDKFNSSDLAYVIVLQSGEFAYLKTAISAPIRKLSADQVMKNLHVPVVLEGQAFHISMAELAAFPLKQLGQFVENQSICHNDVMAAVDLLFAGF
jgi:CcdB protein